MGLPLSSCGHRHGRLLRTPEGSLEALPPAMRVNWLGLSSIAFSLAVDDARRRAITSRLFDGLDVAGDRPDEGAHFARDRGGDHGMRLAACRETPIAGAEPDWAFQAICRIVFGSPSRRA